MTIREAKEKGLLPRFVGVKVEPVKRRPGPFHEFAKRKRQAAGLSQDALAQAFGFSHRANVSKMEAGKLDWRLKHVVVLAELLGMTAAKLVEEYESQSQSQL